MDERTIALATTNGSGASRVIDPPRRAAPPDIWDEVDRSLVRLPKRFFFPPRAENSGTGGIRGRTDGEASLLLASLRETGLQRNHAEWLPESVLCF